MQDRKLLLRVTLKIFTGFSIAWIIYIFFASFFITDHANISSKKFDLSSLKQNSASYFQFNQRQLLVIKLTDNYIVFWADDPVYGCQLEFKETFIKPVCIDIIYGLDGYNKDKNQFLLKPEYDISLQNELIIY